MKNVVMFATLCFVLGSCSVPSFTSQPKDAYCACDDGSGKYGPKGEKCGEKLKEKIGKQGYYGELEVNKTPAYFSKTCRNSP